MGYAPGLAWVRFNQKVAFHHGDTISKSTISLATPDDSVIHRRPYYGMQCNVEMMQQIINKATTTLKIEYILWTNKLALMTNILIYVSTSSRKASFPNKCFSYIIPRCFFISFYRFNLYLDRASLSIWQTNYSGATKLQWVSILLGAYCTNFRFNNITNLS